MQLLTHCFFVSCNAFSFEIGKWCLASFLLVTSLEMTFFYFLSFFAMVSFFAIVHRSLPPCSFYSYLLEIPYKLSKKLFPFSILHSFLPAIFFLLFLVLFLFIGAVIYSFYPSLSSLPP